MSSSKAWCCHWLIVSSRGDLAEASMSTSPITAFHAAGLTYQNTVVLERNRKYVYYLSVMSLLGQPILWTESLQDGEGNQELLQLVILSWQGGLITWNISQVSLAYNLLVGVVFVLVSAPWGLWCMQWSFHWHWGLHQCQGLTNQNISTSHLIRG